MASKNDKTLKYKIDIETAKSKAEISQLKVEIKKLEDAIANSDKRTKESKALTDRLAVSRLKLIAATNKETQTVRANTQAHKNSSSAINTEIQRLQALNRTLDMNSQEYAQNSVEINNLSNSMNRSSGATGQASSAAIELGRVISDAPYGIRGVANNLSQLSTQLIYMSNQSLLAAGKAITLRSTLASLTVGIKSMFAALAGPLGILLAIQAVIAAMDFFASSTKDAAEEVEELNVGLDILLHKFDTLSHSVVFDSLVDDINEVGGALFALRNEFGDIDKKLKDLEDTLKRPLTRDEILSVVNDYRDLLDVRKEIKVIQDDIKKKSGEEDGGMFGLSYTVAQRQADNESLANLLKRKALLESIFRIEKNKGGGKTVKNKSGRGFQGNGLDLSDENQKNRDAEMLAVIRHEEDKRKFLQEVETRELKDIKTAANEREAVRLEKFIQSQQRRIANAAGNEFIINDANKLIQQANVTHQDTLLTNEEEYIEASKILKEKQSADDFVAFQENARMRIDHQLEMEANAIEASSWIKANGMTIQKDMHDEELALLEEEKAILKLRLDAKFDNYEEQLKAQKDFSDKSLEITNKTAKREMEIDQAKADFRNALFNATKSAFGDISNLMKKGSREQKAFALLEIAANTAQGLVNGLIIAQKGAEGDGPAAPYTFAAYYATQTAAVLGAAAKAKAVLQGGSPSGGAESSATVQPSSFNPEFNIVGNSNENALAESIGNQANTPTQAFVVYEDIVEAGDIQGNAIEASGI